MASSTNQGRRHASVSRSRSRQNSVSSMNPSWLLSIPPADSVANIKPFEHPPEGRGGAVQRASDKHSTNSGCNYRAVVQPSLKDRITYCCTHVGVTGVIPRLVCKPGKTCHEVCQYPRISISLRFHFQSPSLGSLLELGCAPSAPHNWDRHHTGWTTQLGMRRFLPRGAPSESPILCHFRLGQVTKGHFDPNSPEIG